MKYYEDYLIGLKNSRKNWKVQVKYISFHGVFEYRNHPAYLS